MKVERAEEQIVAMWPCLLLWLVFKAQHKCKSQIWSWRGRGIADHFQTISNPEDTREKKKRTISDVQIHPR